MAEYAEIKDILNASITRFCENPTEETKKKELDIIYTLYQKKPSGYTFMVDQLFMQVINLMFKEAMPMEKIGLCDKFIVDLHTKCKEKKAYDALIEEGDALVEDDDTLVEDDDTAVSIEDLEAVRSELRGVSDDETPLFKLIKLVYPDTALHVLSCVTAALVDISRNLKVIRSYLYCVPQEENVALHIDVTSPTDISAVIINPDMEKTIMFAILIQPDGKMQFV